MNNNSQDSSIVSIKVSVLINNYNYERFLACAVESALSQTYKNIEVIVVDDGSTDGSKQVINNYKDRVISIVKDNGGQASAINSGFLASTGDVICLLDSDDYFLPKKVEKIVDAFREFPETDWYFHPLNHVDENLQDLSPKDMGTQFQKRCDFRRGIQSHGKLTFHAPATSGLCFRRTLLQKILPMPEGENISISDHYIKFLAMGLSPGVYLGDRLACQIVHGDNAYTDSDNNSAQKSKIHIYTAYWMKVNFPEFTKFANNLFAKGLALFNYQSSIEPKCRQVADRYLQMATPIDKAHIHFRAFYHILRFQLLKILRGA